jgi:hypothetical protein
LGPRDLPTAKKHGTSYYPGNEKKKAMEEMAMDKFHGENPIFK